MLPNGGDALPRPEYPRPILQRAERFNLNGIWAFRHDPEDRGLSARWFDQAQWFAEASEPIMVPYPPGSPASGVAAPPSSAVVWYQRSFDRPQWSACGVLLNIGACDYTTDVYLNGHHICRHGGGYTPIQCAIEHVLKPEQNQLIIRVADADTWQQPRGKQAADTRWPIDYDPVIGIWQSVWLEPVQHNYVTSLFSRFELTPQTLQITVKMAERCAGEVSVELLLEQQRIATERVDFGGRDEVTLSLSIDNPQLWSPTNPQLYDLEIVITDAGGQELDRVSSYTGLRQVHCSAQSIFLNGEPVYLKGVLDQGYFPGGWYTALTDDALRKDVELTKAMGFNFARKHQKIEDPRYLYWADKLGLMLWAEMPAGRIFSTQLTTALVQQWPRALIRDRSHPSIIGWVVFNESWGIWHVAERSEQRHLADALYHLTKSVDPSRPVIGNAGWEVSSGDIWAVHSYDQVDGALGERIQRLQNSPQSFVAEIGRPRRGALAGADPSALPMVLSECGGFGFVAANSGPDYADPDFAYGDMATSAAAYAQACAQLLAEIRQLPQLNGFVWTQLTDVQQEVNGLLTFNREPKVAPTLIKQMVEGAGEQG
ncbi:MAG: hypothetical protein GWP70_00180 [Proteobacteria bacterium]|nr:hypothetical protein [Pseudomonadota bacterium]